MSGLEIINEDAPIAPGMPRDFEAKPFYSIAGGASLVFQKSVVGTAHIFRQTHSSIDPVCDRIMIDALVRAQFDGVELRDAGAL